MDIAFPGTWGPLFWRTIHNFALAYAGQLDPMVGPPDDARKDVLRKAASDFFEGLAAVLPCGDCAMHCRAYLANSPPEIEKPGTMELFHWTVRFHNTVNARTFKSQMSEHEAFGLHQKIRKAWRPATADVLMVAAAIFAIPVAAPKESEDPEVVAKEVREAEGIFGRFCMAVLAMNAEWYRWGADNPVPSDGNAGTLRVFDWVVRLRNWSGSSGDSPLGTFGLTETADALNEFRLRFDKKHASGQSRAYTAAAHEAHMKSAVERVWELEARLGIVNDIGPAKTETMGAEAAAKIALEEKTLANNQVFVVVLVLLMILVFVGVMLLAARRRG